MSVAHHCLVGIKTSLFQNNCRVTRQSYAVFIFYSPKTNNDQYLGSGISLFVNLSSLFFPCVMIQENAARSIVMFEYTNKMMNMKLDEVPTLLNPKCRPDHLVMGKRPISSPLHSRYALHEHQFLAVQSNEIDSRRKRRRLQNKVVRISNEQEIRKHHYDKDEVQNSWYSQRDYKRFLDDCRCVIRKADESRWHFQNLSTCQDDTICIRGLEDQLIPRITRFKQKRKKGLIDMVVRQQTIHNLTGTFDACRIRSISVLCSSDSRKWAMELAAYDEAFVRQSISSR